jgi:anti-sigma factor RsiW
MRVMDHLDVLNEERFELLSAYLDGEVTVAERKQVEAWLDTDPEFQRLHKQMLQMQRSFQAMSVPPSESIETTVQQVMARIDRRPRIMVVWSGLGAVAAAAVVGVVSGILPPSQLAPQTAANIPQTGLVVPEAGATQIAPPLMLSLDQPPVAIPLQPSPSNNPDAADK